MFYQWVLCSHPVFFFLNISINIDIYINLYSKNVKYWNANIIKTMSKIDWYNWEKSEIKYPYTLYKLSALQDRSFLPKN